MFFSTPSCRILIMALIAPVVGCNLPACVAQSGELLKGTIQQESFLSPSSEQFGTGSPGLTRKDILSGERATIDPFDNSSGEQGEAAVSVPSSATRTALVSPPVPYHLGTSESSLPENFSQEFPASGRNGRKPAGSSNLQASVSANEGSPNLQASVSANNDPDSSSELRLAWDAWHKRVAAAIFQRFDFFAHSAFKYSPPLMSRISYTVTHDGHIQNLNVVQHSSNPMFDLLITQCVKSLDGDHALLQFPTGSRRVCVDKFGTFTQNNGIEGFKYTTGDRETIHP
jgi:hypothetical protein